ncbi:MAG: ParB N-terminal domain-containing protein [Myxococcales bacterium]|nr:ParB N-terminal domain-containing protein [Myxococcales bacterium]
MTESATKASRVEFTRIEAGVLGNCRAQLKNITELAADIEERGLLQSLLVWHKRQKREPFVLPDGREVWDRYILIGGNRRHAAITLIRERDATAFETVPVTLLVGNEDDALFAQIAENLQREDLTAVDLAGAIFRLRQRGHTQATIAKRLSKSQTFVSRHLKLREHATEEVLRAVAKGEVPFETALAFTDLDEAKQLTALERFRRKKAEDGTRAASADAKQTTGKNTRPSVALIRSHATLLDAVASAPTSPGRIAHAVLAWVLGQGPWPDELPKPDGS